MSCELKGVLLEYFGRTALDIDLSFEDELLICGRRGSGKTNVAKVFCGTAEIERGEVIIDGEHYERTPIKRRPVALISSLTALPMRKSVWEAIAYPLKKRRIACDENHVRALLKDICPDDVTIPTETKCARLDRRQAACVYAARAVIRNPKLVIADSVNSLCDTRLLYDILKNFECNRLFMSDIVCDYDFYKGDVVCIEKGEIIARGTKESLRLSENKFVLSYLFDYSFLPDENGCIAFLPSDAHIAPTGCDKKRFAAEVIDSEKISGGYLLYCRRDDTPFTTVSDAPIRGKADFIIDRFRRLP